MAKIRNQLIGSFFFLSETGTTKKNYCTNYFLKNGDKSNEKNVC